MKTFVIRLFVAAEPDPPVFPALHGLVEEVGSGRRASFGGAEELLAFLQQAASGRAPDVVERHAT